MSYHQPSHLHRPHHPPQQQQPSRPVSGNATMPNNMADPSSRNASGAETARANAINNTHTRSFYQDDPFDDGGAGIDWSAVPDGPAPSAASATAAHPQNQPYGQQQGRQGRQHNQHGQPMPGINQGQRPGGPAGPVTTTSATATTGSAGATHSNNTSRTRPGSSGSVGGGSRRAGTAYNPYGSTTAHRSSHLHGTAGAAGPAGPGRDSLGSAGSAAGSASGGILTDAAVVDGIGRSGTGMSGGSMGSGSGSAMGGTNIPNMSGGTAPVNLSGNAPQQQQQQQQQQQPGNTNIYGGANDSLNATNTAATAPTNDNTTTATAATTTTTAASSQDLLRQIEALTTQLSTKDEEIFNLQIQLTTVEAEASHKTSAAEKVADQKVRAVEDRLRMVQREADSARAGYARERSRRAKGGGGGGGGDVPPPPPQQQQQPQMQPQMQQPRTAVKGTGCVQLGSQVVTPPAALEAAGGMALRDNGGIGGMNGSSRRGGLAVGPFLSRSQRLATHLLLRIDELWPDEVPKLIKGDGDAVSSTTVVDDTEGEEGPQSKRRKRRDDHIVTNAAAATDSVPVSLMRSSAIRPGSREAAMLTQPQQPAAASTVAPASTVSQPLVPQTKGFLNVTDAQGKEKASIRELLTHIVSWEYDGGNAQSPPSVAVLVRDVVQRIASKFANVDVAVAAATSEEGARMNVDLSDTRPTGSKASSSACTDLPTILEDSSWPDVVHLLVILQEILTFSSEAREVLRTWLARTIDPHLRSASEEDSTSIVSLSKSASRISVFGNVAKPSGHALTELSANTREILHSGPDGFARFASRSSSGADCWNQESIEMFCGKLRDILCGAILGRYSLRSTGSEDDGQNAAILNLEKEASILFLTMMSDAPTPSGIDDMGMWSVWYDELLPTAFVEESVPVATTDLISILEDRSTLPRDLPSRRREKKKVRSLPNRAFCGIKDGSGNFVLEMKCRSLEILLCIITCCDESRKHFSREDRLARQALAALLDEVDGSILPAISKFSSSTDNHDTSRSLRFCLGIVSYLTLLCRSEEGFELLRTSMTVDYRGSGTRELSSSGVAAMVDILQCAVLYASNRGCSDSDRENMSLWQRLLDETLEFFHLVYFQVTRIRLRATDVDDINLPTVLASVGERREIFIGCIHHIRSPPIGLRTTLDSANNRHIATMLLKELGYDIEEEDQMHS